MKVKGYILGSLHLCTHRTAVLSHSQKYTILTKIILKYVKEYSQKFPEVKCGEVWGGDGSFVSIKKISSGHRNNEILKTFCSSLEKVNISRYIFVAYSIYI